MIKFTKRNLLLYFKDKGSVFFSLLSVMIAFLLYIIVFRNLYGGGAISSGFDIKGITDTWAIGGILAAPTISTPLGALWVYVDDRKRKLYRDFFTAPVPRWKITGGYLISSFLIGIIMSCALLTATQIYLVSVGGELFTFTQILAILGVIVISTFSGAGFVLFIISLFPSNNAYTCCSLVIGTLVGFLTSNYVPIGMLPESIQTFIKCTPIAHTSALLRQIICMEPIEKIFSTLPPGFNTENFTEYMGIEFSFGDCFVEPWLHVAILVGSGIIFYALAILGMNKKRKN